MAFSSSTRPHRSRGRIAATLARALGVLANDPGGLGEQQLHRQGKGAGRAGREEQRRQRKPRRQLVARGVEAVTTAAREPALCGACGLGSVCYV